jgi:Zn-dependent peptidase ImmA (M78 family)
MPQCYQSSTPTRISPIFTIAAAAVMRTALRFEVEERGATWSGALRILTEHAEELGFLVMLSGVVGSNTHRKLNPREFRGFALADRLAPLAFVNGADTKAAQIFTLVHELVHLWLGEAALDDTDMATASVGDIERWCNQVTAEVLVPLALLPVGKREAPSTEALDHLARKFKVSTLVVLRRLYEAECLRGDEYQTLFSAVYRDAFQLLGFRKLSTFNELAIRLGIG